MRSVDIFGSSTGLLIIVAFLVLTMIVVVQSPLPKSLRALIVVALLLRVVGALARLFVLVFYYHGSGDAVGYFLQGNAIAPVLQSFDLAPFTDPQYRGIHEEQWWGTAAMYMISGIVLSVIGPTMLGEFIVFSLFSFIGLVCFVVAFKRSFPNVAVTRYARWVWLFPSLWFWPSSVGKEAIIVLGLGLTVLGVAGREGRMHWLPLAAGVALVFLIRPQVAALLVVVTIIAYWLGLGGHWTVGRSFQGLLIAVASIVIATIGLQYTGMGSFDLEGMQGYVETEASRRVRGGSGIVAPEYAPTGVAMGFVNVLFRPLPWEADSVPELASSLELMFLWFLVIRHRRRIIRSLPGWRSSRLLRMAAAFIFAYSMSLGMMVSNLGIIARQRIFVFPFIFVFFEAVFPAIRAARARPPIPGGVPPHQAGPQGVSWPVPSQRAPGRSSSR
jgi:hypothetical protein